MQFAESYSSGRIEGMFKRSNQASTPDYEVLAVDSSILHPTTKLVMLGKAAHDAAFFFARGFSV